MSEKNIIVLGGAGYIGSHTARALERSGYVPIVVDNLSRGHKELCAGLDFEQADILDTDALIEIFRRYSPPAIVHFAALIEVGESVEKPDLYFQNNTEGTQSVLKAMEACNIPNIVFSSTAAVYGQVDTQQPLEETQEINPINPYGQSKAEAEKLIQNTPGINSVSLRYFNAAGADDGAEIGEAHFPETHLIPLTIQAALGLRPAISIYGQDYDTKDGTCIRDYIHVSDLAEAHIKAVEYLLEGRETAICNLGSGAGYSVKEIIDAVAGCSENELDIEEGPRREGDPAYLVADNKRAQEILGWQPQKSLDNIIKSAYQWHKSDIYRQLYETSKDKPS